MKTTKYLDALHDYAVLCGAMATFGDIFGVGGHDVNHLEAKTLDSEEGVERLVITAWFVKSKDQEASYRQFATFLRRWLPKLPYRGTTLVMSYYGSDSTITVTDKGVRYRNTEFFGGTNIDCSFRHEIRRVLGPVGEAEGWEREAAAFAATLAAFVESRIEL